MLDWLPTFPYGLCDFWPFLGNLLREEVCVWLSWKKGTVTSTVFQIFWNLPGSSASNLLPDQTLNSGTLAKCWDDFPCLRQQGFIYNLASMWPLHKCSEELDHGVTGGASSLKGERRRQPGAQRNSGSTDTLTSADVRHPPAPRSGHIGGLLPGPWFNQLELELFCSLRLTVNGRSGQKSIDFVLW